VNYFYYTFKPFIPKRIRYALRRSVALRKRLSYSDVWPVDEIAGRTPDGWPGWPDGKKFAVVLTHDVEGLSGVAKTPVLQQLEIAQGFRSSFNFVPEGEYRISQDYRKQLTDAGFEVGIHDLHHDGKLFRGHKSFTKSAVKINQYLQQWNAVGFRAGFMLRNLDWYHQLNVLYDASTFDTDPLEPMPSGMRTIYPFWLDNPKPNVGKDQPTRPGYVELPYTLPQDSTTYIILGETTPKLWLDKLHWIAKHGGMVLLNTHPDYMQFAHTDKGLGLYPSEHYVEFLRTIRELYAGQYWNPLPKEIALWYKDRCVIRKNAPTSNSCDGATVRGNPLRGKRAAVVLYSTYPSDPRPYRAAQALLREGMEVDFFCIGEKKSPSCGELIDGVRVFRFLLIRRRDNKIVYILKYAQFLFAAFRFLTKRSIKRKYDIVHVHNMPDVLVFSALLPKLQGAKIILDLHDPMPELMTTIFALPESHLFVRVLRRLERWSIRFADLVLTPNIAFKRLFASRSCRADKIQIVMNAPEENIFDPNQYPSASPSGQTGRSFRIMHHGSILHRHGVDLLVDVVARLRTKIPNIQLDIYGSRTPFLDEVLAHAKALKVEDIVTYHGGKLQPDIARAILECDVGIVPNRHSGFTEINFPTRIFEYLAMGRPVVTPASEGICDYFSAENLLMFKPDDLDDLAAKILWVWENPTKIPDLVERGLQVYRSNRWSTQKTHFIGHVSELLQQS
jgi:glycosyltransferase involved in cell wall biosynthesis